MSDLEGRAPLNANLPPDRQELEKAIKAVLGNAAEISIEPGIMLRRRDDGRLLIDEGELGHAQPEQVKAILVAAEAMQAEATEAGIADPGKYTDPARNPWLPKPGID